MKELLTPRQVAQAIDMSESSLKRWCDQGLIQTVRTAGGHRRLPLNGVLTFLRQSGYEIVHPELLGLPPSTTGGKNRKILAERQRLIHGLQAGDELLCTEIVLNLYLSGIRIDSLCDDVIDPAFGELNQHWGNTDAAVYQQRRCCEIFHRVLYELRRVMPEILPTAPVAVGGTLEGDPFTIGSTMVELVLRENGWRACSLGAMLPFLSLRQALCDMRPRLVWLNVSFIRDEATFDREFGLLSKLAQDNDVLMVNGGHAYRERDGEASDGTFFYMNHEELARFSQVVYPFETNSKLPKIEGSSQEEE